MNGLADPFTMRFKVLQPERSVKVETLKKRRHKTTRVLTPSAYMPHMTGYFQ